MHLVRGPSSRYGPRDGWLWVVIARSRRLFRKYMRSMVGELKTY